LPEAPGISIAAVAGCVVTTGGIDVGEFGETPNFESTLFREIVDGGGKTVELGGRYSLSKIRFGGKILGW